MLVVYFSGNHFTDEERERGSIRVKCLVKKLNTNESGNTNHVGTASPTETRPLSVPGYSFKIFLSLLVVVNTATVRVCCGRRFAAGLYVAWRSFSVVLAKELPSILFLLSQYASFSSVFVPWDLFG